MEKEPTTIVFSIRRRSTVTFTPRLDLLHFSIIFMDHPHTIYPTTTPHFLLYLQALSLFYTVLLYIYLYFLSLSKR